MATLFYGLVIPLLFTIGAITGWYGWYQQLFPELSCYRRIRNRLSVLFTARNHALDHGHRRWVTTLLPWILLAAIQNFDDLWIVWIGYGLVTCVVIVPDVYFLDLVRKFVRRELVKRGMTICLTCGYDLRCDKTGRCPECGSRVEFVPGPTRPFEESQ